MERWKIIYAHNARNKPEDKPSKQEERAARQQADAIYSCEHGVAMYRLRPDEAGLYTLPRPVCVECRREMGLIEIFGEARLAKHPKDR